MGDPPHGRAEVQAETRHIAQSAIASEIESLVLGRMGAAGGNIARLASLGSFLRDALGIVGAVSDIIRMGMAGYEAMTTRRRMVMRVAASHGFGYWVFQNDNIPNPVNPPDSFQAMNRVSDQSDQEISRLTNTNFSSDAGRTSADWNIIWRHSVQSSVSKMQHRLMDLARCGQLQRVLRERFPRARFFDRAGAANNEAIVTQYRLMILCTNLVSPAVAAGGFFLSSLRDASDVEKVCSLELYQRVPYNPHI